MKRILCLALALFLLVCAGTAVASAGAGSASDPLISLSYINGTYIDNVLNQVKSLLSSGENAVKNHLSTALSGAEGGNPLNGYKSFYAVQGDSFTLPFGSSLILVDGAARVGHNGTVLNTAQGTEVAPGDALSKNLRYLVAEDTEAVFTVTSNSAQVMIEGSHSGGTETVSFSDVPPSHFAYAAIQYFAGQGLVSGIGNNKFDPSGLMTRGMFVTLLGRVYGVNSASYPGSSFSDVSTSQYYAPYVQWASQTGLVKGMGDGTFAPNDPITRQQMAKLVVDFADYAGYNLGTGTAALTFADDGQIAAWAKTEVYRAQRAGLVNGRGDNLFEPQATANRAEVCTLVYRLITA